MPTQLLLFGIGVFLSAIGIFLSIGIFTRRPRLFDASGVRLSKTCQLLLGISFVYGGIGAVAKSFGENVVNFKSFMILIGTLIVVALWDEVRRIIDAIRHNRPHGGNE